MKRAIIMLGVAVLFVMAGVSVHAEDQSQDQQAAQAEAPAVHVAINVGNTVCPVSGEEIAEETKATYEYEGKVYNFCCAACIKPFASDPQQYIAKVDEELKAKAK